MTGEQLYYQHRFVSVDMSKPSCNINGQLQCQICYYHFDTTKDLRDHVAGYQVGTPCPPAV